MAATNFAALTPRQKIVWAREVWSEARDNTFTKRFTGTSENSMIQRITELTKTEKGERVLMQLVADLVEDGVIGDNQREGNEEEMQSYSQEITIDLISHQVKNKGKLSEQKTVLNFRQLARSRLAYWLTNRVDQLVMLNLAGISYAYTNNGALRSSKSPFKNLAFAEGNQQLTAKRHLAWNGTALVPSDTTVIDSTYVPSYNMITEMVAYAKDHYIKPLMDGGKEYYVWLVKPGTLAKLKRDPDYQRAIVTAMPRGKENPFFTGGVVTVDGIVIHEHRLVYSNTGAAAGQKWGAGGNVNGTRSVLCGAQALGMADIGSPEWDEEEFDYKTKQGISVDKMFGLLNPQFYSIYDKSVEDFGKLTIDLAL